MTIDPRTPVLVGVGQALGHWSGLDVQCAPSPLSLSCDAAREALADTNEPQKVAKTIDVVASVRTNADSTPGEEHPFGRCANPPATLAAALGLDIRRAVYSAVGGDQPQALANEFAETIFSGDARSVLLAGAEATAAAKSAERNRLKLDWSDSAAGEMEDRGFGPRLLSDYEITNGLSFPTQTYPIFEQALRARLGMGRGTYRRFISELWASMSSVAATNPYAQFPVTRSAEFLETVSPDNYPIADPYLKWHVAQDAVNQGAALILTSVGEARRLGIDPAKWVYLHGYGQASDKLVTERADLSRSQAMELVLQRALQSAGKSVADMAYFDLYSCFPCAVLIAAECLGIDTTVTVPTVTGGLSFFGGPGNNYSMHAIASMAMRLRQDPGAFGLVLANGGFLSKEAAGVYSTAASENWRPVSSADLQAIIDTQPAMKTLNESVDAVVESYTVTYRRGTPNRGYVSARAAGGRILARARTGHRATLAAISRVDPIGQPAHVDHEGGVNYFCPSTPLGAHSGGDLLARAFEFVLVERRGHVLEVTLNRPDQFNALHSAAHFELHEIWDDFERDQDLWVAIITGAGDRGFCSGNDLKATARGGDMSIPGSGFAGLCSRFNREKPVIAAVNGVALGGGLEIVLSCDLAIADHRAEFALPEVRVGLFAAAGGAQRLTRQIGRKLAMDMLLTGRRLTADQALEFGIVNAVAPKGESLQGARALADVVLASSPSAVRATKQALNKLEEIESLETALKANASIFGRLMKTSDFKEGVAAFTERRAPRWTNS